MFKRFFGMVCCTKDRANEGDEPSQLLGAVDSKFKNANRVLLEFVTEESKLGMREIECFEMIEKIFLCSNKGEIPKKDIVHIYK